MSKESIDVIAERLRGMEERLTERIDLIYEQTKKTNGRVNVLETWKNGADWKIGITFFCIFIIISFNFPSIWEHIKTII